MLIEGKPCAVFACLTCWDGPPGYEVGIEMAPLSPKPTALASRWRATRVCVASCRSLAMARGGGLPGRCEREREEHAGCGETERAVAFPDAHGTSAARAWCGDSLERRGPTLRHADESGPIGAG